MCAVAQFAHSGDLCVGKNEMEEEYKFYEIDGQTWGLPVWRVRRIVAITGDAVVVEWADMTYTEEPIDIIREDCPLLMKYFDEQDLLCPICLDNVRNGEEVTMTACYHYYHDNCLNEVTQYTESCPVCRQYIYESDTE